MFMASMIQEQLWQHKHSGYTATNKHTTQYCTVQIAWCHISPFGNYISWVLDHCVCSWSGVNWAPHYNRCGVRSGWMWLRCTPISYTPDRCLHSIGVGFQVYLSFRLQVFSCFNPHSCPCRYSSSWLEILYVYDHSSLTAFVKTSGPHFWACQDMYVLGASLVVEE